MDETILNGNMTGRSNINLFDNITIHDYPASPVPANLIWPSE